MKKSKKIKKIVKEKYSNIAAKGSSCCDSSNSCCKNNIPLNIISKKIGYRKKDFNIVPKEANLGLGCGTPVKYAKLKKGEIVLDLGSGAGFDCFLASKQVGEKGKVIGVDMTPEMIKKARKNASKGNYKNIIFKLGDIENLPIKNNSIDVVISNCVINLAPDKEKVFREIYRVLKNNGRMIISDIVLLKKLPQKLKESMDAYISCIAGAMLKNDYINLIKSIGYKKVKILQKFDFSSDNKGKKNISSITVLVLK